MHPARHPRGRRTLVHAALVGLLATIVFALAQCTMVEDQLTNVDPSKHRNSECIRQCKDAFREALRAEIQLHRENLRACGVQDDDGDGDEDDARTGDLTRARDGRNDDDFEGGDHGGNNGRKECVRAEARRHRAEIQEIEDARKECIRNCHHQGGGNAG